MKPLEEDELELLQLAKGRKCSFGVKDPGNAEEIAAVLRIEGMLQQLHQMGFVSDVHSIPNHQTRLGGFGKVFVSSITPAGERALALHDTAAFMSKIADPARGQIDLELKRSMRALDGELEAIAGSHVGRGTLRSGMYLDDCSKAMRASIEASTVVFIERWMALARASGFAMTDGARDAIAAELHGELTRMRDQVHSRYERVRDSAGGLGVSDLSPLPDELLQEADQLLRYAWMQAPAQAHPPAQSTVDRRITVHGDVGAVQSGDFAVAHVTQQAAVDLTELQGVLTQLLQPSLGLSKDVLAMVEEALTESRAERPNLIRIRSLALGAAMTIQTLGALPGAADLATAVLAHFGVVIK